ncbi:Lead, cadmium, zinc and mercury transporting ATPase 3B Copper-translocating P-type ATPase [Pseudomonas syringae pv. syringae]|nr:Lead, cadmium, zinc and mercury transporting ATPase 3B Copper-translocating P-type ATPase [Pseudomonas syringae pv. syringae]
MWNTECRPPRQRRWTIVQPSGVTPERAERSPRLSCDALRRMPFWTPRVLLTTQSVETCIPTPERAERSPRLSCGAPRRMPFRTLCVLLAMKGKKTRHTFIITYLPSSDVPFAPLMIQG